MQVLRLPIATLRVAQDDKFSGNVKEGQPNSAGPLSLRLTCELELDGGGAGRDAADFGGAGFGVSCSAEQGGAAIEDDAHRHVHQ